jgi:PIN domain nuclease of toxin-antitoxin system
LKTLRNTYSHDLFAGHLRGPVVEKLPFHHRDPFDRLIVASAQVEKITLLSDDTEMKKYKVARKW